jgi:hypothetical protein
MHLCILIKISSQALLFPLFQLQSNWVAGVLSGRIKLPSQDEMMEHVATFYREMEADVFPKRNTHNLGACTVNTATLPLFIYIK